MRQLDRQWATFIIWAIFTILILMVFDRGMMITADFSGLWPQSTGYSMAQDVEQLSQVIASAREVSPSIFARVEEAIKVEMAMRVPLVVAGIAMLVLAAALCTYFIWRHAGIEAYLAREIVQAEKIKRHNRIEQFVEDLDTDELAQLRTRISGEGKHKLK